MFDLRQTLANRQLPLGYQPSMGIVVLCGRRPASITRLRTSPTPQSFIVHFTGIISGAGDYRPAITLDKHASARPRSALALVGKVYCKVDASYAPIEVGDMLTTSPTRGHAMKAVDAVKSFGAVIGKALNPISAGVGLIPVLVALQ